MIECLHGHLISLGQTKVIVFTSVDSNVDDILVHQINLTLLYDVFCSLLNLNRFPNLSHDSDHSCQGNFDYFIAEVKHDVAT